MHGSVVCLGDNIAFTYCQIGHRHRTGNGLIHTCLRKSGQVFFTSNTIIATSRQCKCQLARRLSVVVSEMVNAADYI